MATDLPLSAVVRRLKRTVLGIPGVLAVYQSLPLRFQRGARRLRTQSPEQIFTDIYRNKAWGAGDSASGAGSSVQQTRDLVAALPVVFAAHEVSTVLDIPCGDFHWMQHVDLRGIDYVGADIVQDLIDANTARHTREHVRFEKLDLLRSPLPQVDLIVCRDCLVHFSFDDVFRALQAICDSGSSYLLTTTFTDKRRNRDIATGQWRPLNLQVAPFHLPAPLQLLRERCTEGDGAYADKSLGLWRVDDIRGSLVTRTR